MRRVAILLPALIVVVAASASFLTLSRTNAVQDPRISLDMDMTGNTYDGAGAQQLMNVGTIDNCLSEGGNDLAHNVQAHLIVQNVEDLAGAQVRINHDDTRLEVTNVLWTPFSDPNTLTPVGFLNLPIDPITLDHRGVTGANDFSAPNTSLAAQSYLGDQNFPISPDTPAKAAPDDSSYSAPTGGILATVVINVKAGQQGQASLAIDLDDGDPNVPGSSVDIFTTAGIVKVNLLGFQLGDGFIGNGATCVAGAQETPFATPTPSGQAGTATPTAAATTPGGTGRGGATTPAGGTGAAGRTPTGAPGGASPAALPPTGDTTDGDSSAAWVYALLLAGAIATSATGAYGLSRLRKR